jgi:DNA invertase Pin-like site-specific DNA recombinase
MAEADRQARESWGGFSTYIAVRRGMPAGMQHAAAVRRDYYQHHMHYGAICRKYGISKSTVYRILGQKEQADQ